MGAFSNQCKRLKELYLSSNEENSEIKIKFLSKLLSLVFFMNANSLPSYTPFNIFIGDINSDENTLVACLMEVINDLNYTNCRIDRLPCAEMLSVHVMV